MSDTVQLAIIALLSGILPLLIKLYYDMQVLRRQSRQLGDQSTARDVHMQDQSKKIDAHGEQLTAIASNISTIEALARGGRDERPQRESKDGTK